MAACAITDHGNMFGAVEFYAEAKNAGVKPIIGCEIYVAPRQPLRQGRARIDDYEAGGNYHLILLAMNREGYSNLCRLVTAGYLEGFYYKPRIDKELLRELNGGLIALSGCLRGEVAHSLIAAASSSAPAALPEELAAHLRRPLLRRDPGQRPAAAGAGQRRADQRWRASWACRSSATNDCHYLEPEDAAAHEVLLCIQTGKTFTDEKRWKFETDQLYVK